MMGDEVDGDDAPSSPWRPLCEHLSIVRASRSGRLSVIMGLLLLMNMMIEWIWSEYGDGDDEYENSNDSEYGKKTSIPETDEAMKPAAE